MLNELELRCRSQSQYKMLTEIGNWREIIGPAWNLGGRNKISTRAAWNYQIGRLLFWRGKEACDLHIYLNICHIYEQTYSRFPGEYGCNYYATGVRKLGVDSRLRKWWSQPWWWVPSPFWTWAIPSMGQLTMVLHHLSGLWFQTWLDYFPFHIWIIWVVILPIDFHIFQDV